MQRSIVLLIWLFVCSVVQAEDVFYNPSGENSEYVDQKPWVEAGIELPAGINESMLKPVVLDGITLGFDLYVDTASISLGKDKVVRLISVLQSRSGVRNISYEGYHCAAEDYRVYARDYGNGLEFSSDSEWIVLDHRQQGSNSYRRALLHQVLCDDGQPFRPGQIIRIIKGLDNTNIDQHEEYL